jgi:hypothetical protein
MRGAKTGSSQDVSLSTTQSNIVLLSRVPGIMAANKDERQASSTAGTPNSLAGLWVHVEFRRSATGTLPVWQGWHWLCQCGIRGGFAIAAGVPQALPVWQ